MDFTRNYMMVMQQSGYDSVMRISDIVLLHHYFIENVIFKDIHKHSEYMKICQRLCLDISKKIGLHSDDVKQLAYVLLGILNSIYNNEANHVFLQNDKFLGEILDAALNLLSTSSMKVRANISNFDMERYSLIDS